MHNVPLPPLLMTAVRLLLLARVSRSERAELAKRRAPCCAGEAEGGRSLGSAAAGSISEAPHSAKLWDRGVSHKPALEPGYQQQHRTGPTLNGK